jgi:hypothetical protein
MSRNLLQKVDLTGSSPIAQGGVRDVYLHPEFDDVLVKVIRADRIDGRGELTQLRRKWKPNRAYGCYISFHRELSETLRFARNAFRYGQRDLPFAPAIGIVATSHGPGLLVGKVAAPDGSPAPTLMALVKERRFTLLHRRKLDAFFQECIDCHVVLNDVHASNFLWLGTEEDGRFVCIDGLGEKMLIPVHRLSKTWNMRKLLRKREKLLEWIDRTGRHAAERASRALETATA